MRRVKTLLYVLCLSLTCSSLAAQSPQLAPAVPQEIGLSKPALDDITQMLERQVSEGKIAGAVAAVARHGRIGYLQAVGDRAPDTAMQTDTLFRIASMTKIITCAGVMSLVEDGHLTLDAPLSNFLPEFAGQRVLVDPTGASLATTSAAREPTIHDLLTHRSGLTYGWFGPAALDEIYREHDLTDLFVPTDETMGQRVSRLARVPLKFQPGSAWDYSLSTDVLGRVIEAVSGLTLEQFLRERFFRPLSMNDTFFAVPDAKWSRMSALYTTGEDQSLQLVSSQPITAGFLRFSDDYCRSDNRFEAGGSGLVSTAGDYLRFLQMLLAGGELEGTRVLQAATVELMTRNHIGDMRIPFPDHGDGFGLGFGVLTPAGVADDVASVGTYSWGGVFNTYFWVDPQEQFIGVLMTQLFPYNHLNTRTEFKRLAYAALDDSGFEQRYWYEPGEEFANPHFNGRQLRVNAPAASTDDQFASRSEVRSSGLARIEVEEDLREVRRADLMTEMWGGHPGTANKRVSVNGRTTRLIPEVGAASHHCTHQYPSFNLRRQDLVNGYNSCQFACDQGDTFWGHYIVDNAALCVGLSANDPRLQAHELSNFSAQVSAQAEPGGEGFRLQLNTETPAPIAAVHFQAKYFGYDENGNGWRTDWHGMTRDRRPYGVVGSATSAPFEMVWDTSLLPAQQRVAVRAIVEFEEPAELVYRTAPIADLEIAARSGERVAMFDAQNMPAPFWSRADRVQTCVIDVDVEPTDIVSAQLNVVAWTGGAGDVQDYFTLNGTHFPIAEGDQHRVVYSQLAVDPSLLVRGENTLRLHSDSTHHGIEILLPGPALMVHYRTSDEEDASNSSGADARSSTNDSSSTGSVGQLRELPPSDLQPGTVRLVESARDTSAGDLECYRIETPSAVYYLDKVGAGLSSMIDRQGHDWLGFHPRPGSGAAGEYRGFPNAVFQEAGNYFHATNEATDPCVTIVELQTPERIVISALSDHGQWAGRYTFTADSCTFTMTKMPAGHKYWVLYEGTPGGQYDDNDWWMTAEAGRNPLTKNHDGDIADAEWIAFGDPQVERMLVLSHAEGDEHPDRFYAMQKQMTVMGFGRAGMQKFLDSVPQSFTIGFVEGTSQADAERFAADHHPKTKDQASISPGDVAGRRRALEQFALTQTGDRLAGQGLFFDDRRTQCSICHRIGDDGGKVGPDLSRIGGKFDRPHLIESLLEPSRQIVEGYRTSLILTADGKTYSGVLKTMDDQFISLVDAHNKMHHIAAADVEYQRETSVSLMPTGLADMLSPREFTDLVAYLESLRSGEAKFGAGISGPIELPDGFEISTVATGLSGATALEVAPDGRVFICEQAGQLRIVKDDNLLDQPFATISVENNWERGLIGVTVPPEFPKDPYVYMVYVTDQPHTHHRISRLTADGDLAVPGSEEILLTGDDQSLFGGNVPAGHQGGAIHFGPDGKLYVGLGEQTAKTPAQRLDALQGKLLRIKVDGTIPGDNPFLDRTEGKYQSIWAVGCRNPFTFAFRDSTGELFINDVGGKFEEINRGKAGANYGWPVVDHGPTDRSGVTGPIHIYPQASISGGDFSSDQGTWPAAYRGRYFFADFVHGWIKALDPSAPSSAVTFAEGLRRPVDMRFAPDGSLYVLLRNAWVVDQKFQDNTGSLMRIRYVGEN